MYPAPLRVVTTVAVVTSPKKLTTAEQQATSPVSFSDSEAPLLYGILSNAKQENFVFETASDSDNSSNLDDIDAVDPLYISDLSGREGCLNSNNQDGVVQNTGTIGNHVKVLYGEPPRYQCNICMKEFMTKAHEKYHRYCGIAEKPFKCIECGRGFVTKHHYEYHTRIHTGERPYICHTCGARFTQRSGLTRHIRSHTGEKPCLCEHCGKGVSSKQALRAHYLKHMGARPSVRKVSKPRLPKELSDLPSNNVCCHCSLSFSSKKDLIRHITIHTGECPFSCRMCNSKFGRKDNLQRHLRNIHMLSKQESTKFSDDAASHYIAKDLSESMKQSPKEPYITSLEKVSCDTPPLESSKCTESAIETVSVVSVAMPTDTGHSQPSSIADKTSGKMPNIDTKESFNITQDVTYWYMSNPEYELMPSMKMQECHEDGV